MSSLLEKEDGGLFGNIFHTIAISIFFGISIIRRFFVNRQKESAYTAEDINAREHTSCGICGRGWMAYGAAGCVQLGAYVCWDAESLEMACCTKIRAIGMSKSKSIKIVHLS